MSVSPFYLANRGQLRPDALTPGPASALHRSTTQPNPVWDQDQLNKRYKKFVDENIVQLCLMQLNFELIFYYYFLSNGNESVFTCSFVLVSRRPVQRSLFLFSFPAMMAPMMMVMVMMSFLNWFLQNVVIQIHLLRALWCKSGCRASHRGIRNGLRKKTRWWLDEVR